MYYSKKSISQFLKGAKALVFAVKEDDFIKERISVFNYDETRLDEFIAIHKEAEKTESDKSKEFGEQLEAKAIFDKLMEEAEKLYQKHTDFLKLALYDKEEKQRKLFLVGQPRTRKLLEWFKNAEELYNKVLEDEEAVNAVAKYAITKEDLEEGRKKILAAESSKRKHTEEMGEAQDATDLRDAAFKKLAFVVDELITVCTYALEDRPQLLEKLGIQVLSPGYKRKRKKKEEKKGEGAEVTEDVNAEEKEAEVVEDVSTEGKEAEAS